MQAIANNNLVLTDFSSFGLAESQATISDGGFYQRIASYLIGAVHKEQVFRELGDRLVVLAEHSHAFRRMDVLEQVSPMLVSIPLPPEYQAVGRYYQAVCTQRFGFGDVGRAATLLEGVAENAPPRYRVRAILCLGANSRHRLDNRSALSLYREAGRFVSQNSLHDPCAIIHTQKMVAVIKSEDGNHRAALAMLENLFPLANEMRSSQPHVYYDYLNSLAVELGEVGRLEEARHFSQIVLASPFAPAYPEWRETREEIAIKGWRASRSVVAFTQGIPEASNIVRLPASDSLDRRSSIEPAASASPATVLSMQQWKKKMTKQSNGDPQDRTIPRPTTEKEKQARAIELRRLDTRQMLMRVIKAIGDEDVTDDQLLRALMILEGADPDENQGA